MEKYNYEYLERELVIPSITQLVMGVNLMLHLNTQVFKC